MRGTDWLYQYFRIVYSWASQVKPSRIEFCYGPTFLQFHQMTIRNPRQPLYTSYFSEMMEYQGLPALQQ